MSFKSLEKVKKCVVAEISVGPVVLPTGMGSFDCVRLAPRFTQDDSIFWLTGSLFARMARASTVRYSLLYVWMLEAH